MGKVLHPRDIDSVYIRLGQEWPSNQKIRPMGKYKFLVTFFTRKTLMMLWCQVHHFYSQFSMRTGNGLCQTRRIWLEYHCIPIHGWSRHNLTKTGKEWGRVIML